MLVDAKGCYIFYGIIPPRDPGDVSPDELAIQLGWALGDPETGEAVGLNGEEYDIWLDEHNLLQPQGLVLDFVYCDGYPLTHIFAKGTDLVCDEEYPLAFSQLPPYTEDQRLALEKLAAKLGYDSPRWHLGTTPVE